MGADVTVCTVVAMGCNWIEKLPLLNTGNVTTSHGPCHMSLSA